MTEQQKNQIIAAMKITGDAMLIVSKVAGETQESLDSLPYEDKNIEQHQQLLCESADLENAYASIEAAYAVLNSLSSQ